MEKARTFDEELRSLDRLLEITLGKSKKPFNIEDTRIRLGPLVEDNGIEIYVGRNSSYSK